MTAEPATAVKNQDEAKLSDPLLQRIHRIFAVFSDSERHISPQQAHFIIGHLFRLSGGTEQVQNSLPTLLRSDTITFHDLLRVCDLLFPDRKQFEPLVDRVFERYVQHIIIKVGTFDEDRFTWLLSTDPNKRCLFGHFDELRRKQWMSAMKLAMERRSAEEMLQYDRKCSRSTECRTVLDKNLSWRLALECENERLMRLLDEQRRALRDEEIVRTLAARMFDEERERREKLEEKLCILERNLSEKCDSNSQTDFIERLKCLNGNSNTSLTSSTSVQTNGEEEDDDDVTLPRSLQVETD